MRRLSTNNTSPDPLDRAEIASADVERQYLDAKDRFRTIVLDRKEIDHRLYHYKRLRGPPPTLNNSEIARVLLDVAAEMGRPYTKLEAEQKKTMKP